MLRSVREVGADDQALGEAERCPRIDCEVAFGLVFKLRQPLGCIGARDQIPEQASPLVVEEPARVDDGTKVTRKTWGQGRNGAEVVLIEIAGAGHTWPGRKPPLLYLGKATQNISANDAMWEFFQRHSRK